jgi:adenylate kinase
MRLVFLGPPGAGKGTQAADLARDLRIAHIATGDLFRQAQQEDTPLGRQVRDYMQRGELVRDDLTNAVVRERISQPDARLGFILDGYPRTLEQALALDQALEELGSKLDLVVRFMVSAEEVVRRLSGRRVCPTCNTVYHVIANPPRVEGVCDKDGTPLIQREDDAPETIRRRLEVFEQQTKVLKDFYAERGLLKEVDATGTPEEVFGRLHEVVVR